MALQTKSKRRQGFGRDQVFVSYSRNDREWLERVVKVLTPLTRDQTLKIWHDGTIRPSANWRSDVNLALEECSVGLLLVSPDFLSSTFINEVELPYLLSRSSNAGVKLVWVLLRDCLWQKSALAEIQGVNAGRPLNALSEAECDTELVRISLELEQAIAA